MRREDVAGDEKVPIFGTWRGIYAAVIACALLVMGAVALFQGARW